MDIDETKLAELKLKKQIDNQDLKQYYGLQPGNFIGGIGTIKGDSVRLFGIQCQDCEQWANIEILFYYYDATASPTLPKNKKPKGLRFRAVCPVCKCGNYFDWYFKTEPLSNPLTTL